MQHLLKYVAAGIPSLIGIWYVRRLLSRQRRNDDRLLKIDIEGHYETFEQYRARHEREFRARAHARNVEERRICHLLAPIMGGAAAVYAFITEQSLISRVEMAAIYFAVGYLAIWATYLFDWLLRPTELSARHLGLLVSRYSYEQQQLRDRQQAQH